MVNTSSQPSALHRVREYVAQHRLFNSAWWPLLMVILPCTLADFVYAPAINYQFRYEWLGVVAFGSMGLIVAQIGLLNLGLVFSSEPFVKRLAMAWYVALVCYLCWLLGYCQTIAQSGWIGEYWEEVAVWAASDTLIIAAGTQFPLWIARVALGWRLIRTRPQDEPAPAEAKLSIRHLMMATALVALASTPVRSSYPDLAWNDDPVFLLVRWSLFALVLLVMLPIFLRNWSPWVAWLATILLSILVGAEMLLLYGRVPQLGDANPLYLLSYMPLLAIAAALTLLRRAGWRLTSRRGL